MIKAYKYRIYPNEQQQEMFAKHFGCCRWVYNWGLNQKIELYTKEKKCVSRFDLQAQLPILKKKEETNWLSEVNSQSLQISLDHLDKAFVRFFREKKGFPKFKNKFSKQSYQCFNGVKLDTKNNLLQLPKIKGIKIVLSRLFVGEIKTTTISKTPTGKYFVTLLVENNQIQKPLKEINENTAIGIDMGIKNFITVSNGIVFENNKYLKSSLKRLKCLQRRVSRKIKGSNNRKKEVKKLAKIHEKITNQRLDYIHKITHKLTNENQVNTICIEDLNISGMVKNHHLAQSLSDVAIGKFFDILTYKCNWNGINLVKIGRFDASSKTCHVCGNINHDLGLNKRVYECNCGNVIDRDLNASINIKNWGLHPKNHSGQGMSGESVELSAVVGTKKQKKVNNFDTN